MRYAIDRLEGSKAVLEDDNGAVSVVERSLLPPDAVQGDVIVDHDGCYRLDKSETESRRARIYKLEQMLRKERE